MHTHSNTNTMSRKTMLPLIGFQHILIKYYKSPATFQLYIFELKRERAHKICTTWGGGGGGGASAVKTKTWTEFFLNEGVTWYLCHCISTTVLYDSNIT